jgi:hypothetical protein
VPAFKVFDSAFAACDDGATPDGNFKIGRPGMLKTLDAIHELRAN